MVIKFFKVIKVVFAYSKKSLSLVHTFFHLNLLGKNHLSFLTNATSILLRVLGLRHFPDEDEEEEEENEEHEDDETEEKQEEEEEMLAANDNAYFICFTHI